MEIVEFKYFDDRAGDEKTLLMEKKLSDKFDAFLVSLSLVHNKEAIIEYLGRVMDQEMYVITVFLNDDRKHITCVYGDCLQEETMVNFGSFKNHTLEVKTFIDAINSINL